MRINPAIRAIIQIVLVSVVLFSCKTPETLTETRLRPMSPSRLLRNVQESAFDYTHFNVRRINLQIDDGESKTSFRAGLQAVKDQQIQITVSKFNIPLGRIQLTPDSILFVNYMERTYISGDYKDLSTLVAFDLDFRAIQTIFSANIFSFFDDDDELRDYESFTDGGLYMIMSENYRKIRKIDEKGKTQKMERMMRRADEDALIVQTFGFDPSLFVLRKMILEDKTNKRTAGLRFDDYTKVGQKYYPGTLIINFTSEEGTTGIDARMSGFSTEHSELTPLRIPDRYQRLYLN
ncbi:MAG: DUF4292 domain-containing protein [Bacteroidota bacterium]